MMRRARAAWPFDATDMVAAVGLLLVTVTCILLAASIVAALPARSSGG